MRCPVLIALACALFLGACADDSDEDEPTTPTPASTTAEAPPLAPALDVLRSGDGAAYCDLLTVRFLHDNYGRPGPAALRYCKADAKRDAAEEGRPTVNVEVVSRGKEKATVALTYPGSGRLYYALVSDGERWLVDDIGDSEKDRFFPYRREPTVTDGISSEDLEAFLRELAPQATRMDCQEVEHQNLGEWECAVTVVPRNRPPRKGSALVTVAPDGSVSAGGFGSPLSVGGCCMDLRSD
jgi:hypothetical protein